jgi:hypothetical protein
MLEKITPFGPFIGKGKITDSMKYKLQEIIDRDDLKPANSSLVGYIKTENDILDHIPDDLMTYMKSFIVNYINNIDPGVYKDLIPLPNTVVTCASAWVNIQREGEFNPYHNHNSFDLVCVIFPKISIKNPVPYVSNDKDDKPGSLVLVNGHKMGSGFNKISYTLFPEENDILVFPADLYHYTTPIYGDDVRVSVSSNFVFNNKARTLLNKSSRKI